MASHELAPTRGTNGPLETTDNEKQYIAGTNHVERIDTNDNEIAFAKVAADAKVDEFGARSKTNPEEIALVKKLDRTILVSLLKNDGHTHSHWLWKWIANVMDNVLVRLAQDDPIICAWMALINVYFSFNFLDRNALVNAKLNSLDKDLGLKGTQYNTLISILFVGYIAGQIPSNMILNRVRPSWYLGGTFIRSVLFETNSQEVSVWLGQLFVFWPT